MEEAYGNRSNLGLPEAATTETARIKFKKAKRKRRQINKQRRLSAFERRYTELGSALIPEQKRIDYVLVHDDVSSINEQDPKLKQTYEFNEINRALYENELRKDGFAVQTCFIGKKIYKKLHCPFKRLCAEAESSKLEMPLHGCQIYEEPPSNFIKEFIDKTFRTDDELDYVSAPFFMDRIHLYEGFGDPTHFFSPSMRSLLTHMILINVDVNDDESSLKRKGLPYLLMKGCYSDAFVLHDESEMSKTKEESNQDTGKISKHSDTVPLDMNIKSGTIPDLELQSNQGVDTRKELDNTWTVFYKFQPLWKIRNYFGEKIAFYFAWSGLLITTLWIPTIIGMICFFYGLVLSIESQQAQNTTQPVNSSDTLGTIQNGLVSLMDVIKESFDNDSTPFFALIICLWGTIFLELWKRKTARLAYEWDVDNYENSEPDRPQFFGLDNKDDPVTMEKDAIWFYPVKRQALKFLASGSMLIFMVSMVFASVVAVIVYRVIISVDICPGLSSAECLMLTTILSAVLNAISILILGKLYDKLAVVLTDWENHRTQTRYDDALIIKLFAFQFANSYASCFYIAFFRGRLDQEGMFGLGSSYRDECAGNCMSQLSFQVLVLMFAKPFPKLLKDIIIPFLKKLWRKRPACCCRCTKQNKVDEEAIKGDNHREKQTEFLEREFQKPTLGDFTLGEYTEKVIQYGFLMLFACSFPLAPLLALITNLSDIRVDAKRLLWWYRRPIAFISQDIGTWFMILEFVNVAGVISNGFLIAFTSSWGRRYETMSSKLWIVIGFEHLVFGIKFLIAYLIPDVPGDVRLAIRREKFQVAKKLEEAKKKPKVDYSTLVPNNSHSPSKHSLTNFHADDSDYSDGKGTGATLAPIADESDPETMQNEDPMADSFAVLSTSGVHPGGSNLISNNTGNHPIIAEPLEESGTPHKRHKKRKKKKEFRETIYDEDAQELGTMAGTPQPILPEAEENRYHAQGVPNDR